MYLNAKSIFCGGISLFILSGCATAKPALEGRIDPYLGSAVKANIAAQFVAPSPQQKANTYIPADPNRAALARKNYRENTIDTPTAGSQTSR